MPLYHSGAGRLNGRNVLRSLVTSAPPGPYLARGFMCQSSSTTDAYRSVGTAALLRPRLNEAQTQSTSIAVGISLGLIAFVTALVLIFCCYRTSRRRLKYGQSPGFSIGTYFNDQREAQRRDPGLREPVLRRSRESRRFPDAWNPIWALFDGYSHGRPYDDSTRYSRRRPRGHGSRHVRRPPRRDGSICQPPRVYNRGDPPRPPPLSPSRSPDPCDSPSICDRRHTDGDDDGGGGGSGGGGINTWRKGQWYSASSSQSHPTPSALCSSFDICDPPVLGPPPSSSHPPPGSLRPSQPTADELRLSDSDGYSSTMSSLYGSDNTYPIEGGSILGLPAPPLQSHSSISPFLGAWALFALKSGFSVN
jgi:hypothetical protein